MSARDLRRWVGIVAVAIVAFDLWSSQASIARRGIGVGGDPAPPVYGRLIPAFSWPGLVALALAGAGAWLAARSLRRARAARALPVALLFSFALSYAVAFSGGDAEKPLAPVTSTEYPDYGVDAHLVRREGVRGFVAAYPRLIRDQEIRSLHNWTHPPGPTVLRALLDRIPRPLPRAAALAFLGALMVLPAWLLGRHLGGERAAIAAAFLTAAMPGVLLFGWVSLDAVVGVAMALGAVAVVVWLRPEASARAAAAAGAAIGAVTFVSYGAAFLALGAGIYVLGSTGIRRAARTLGAAAAGGVTALLVLWLVLGFDLFASYAAGHESATVVQASSSRSHLYWIFGDVFAWATFAGAPVVALSLRDLVRRRPLWLIALLTPLVVFYLLPPDLTHIIPGETERTVNHAYPLAGALAGTALARDDAPAPAVALLVAITACWAILLEALYRLPW